jgi:hypothetical protein
MATQLELNAQIAEAEKAIKIAEDAITKAKAAGIDTSAMEMDLRLAKESLAKLKEAYGK